MDMLWFALFQQQQQQQQQQSSATARTRTHPATLRYASILT